MDINLEIEFKSLLSREAFLKIREDYFKETAPFCQTNEYFVDQAGLLRKHLYSLRIRHIHDRIEFTLKKPEGFSKIEMNEYLSKEDYLKLLSRQPFDSKILKELEEIGISLENLSILTRLVTWRYEIKYLGGNLCLDENDYSNQKDYEIEYEALSEEEGRAIFAKLLLPYGISYQGNCLGKMTRAISACQKINS